MADNTKTKTVNYRRCEAEAPAGTAAGEKFNLQELLEMVLKSGHRPWIRPVGMSGTESQFLAHLVHKQGCICGSLLLCASRLIPLVDANEKDGSTWEDTIEPKDSHGKLRKLQEHALFFAVKENHLAIVQSKELAIAQLQDFLVWLIHTQEKLKTNWSFHLLNLPAKSALEKLKDRPIRAVKIGKSAFWMEKTAVPQEEGSASKRQRYVKTLKTDPLLFGMLKQFINDDELIGELEKSKDPGSVYVDVEIRYRSRSEKQAQHLMRAMAATFGDHAELSPEIRLEGNQKIKGEELTISDTLDIQCPGGNLSKDDAMTRVAEWLVQSIKSGKVLL